MALRGLRSRWRKETLWVDALGINQSDDKERASQVSCMGEVYKLAARTFVWLGCSIEPDSAVHEMHSLHRIVLRLAEALPEIRKDVLVVKSDWKLDDMLGWEFRVVPGLQGLHFALTAGFHTLNQALSYTTPSWPDRTWVIQEFILSSTVHFCWDRRKFRAHPDVLSDMLFFEWDRTHARGLRGFISSYTYITRPTSNQDILYVARLAFDSETSEPHDKVFALLDVIAGEAARHIVVDYSAPFWVTCARATYASTKHGRTTWREREYEWKQLRVLEATTLQADRPSSFPSWVADFSRTQLFQANYLVRADFRWPGSHDHFDADLSTDLRCLTTHGVRCGKVMTVLPLYKQAKPPALVGHFELLAAANISPSDQVASFTKLLASALRAHETSGTCTRPEPYERLAELEQHLKHQRGGLVSSEEVEKVLEAFLSCWRSQLVLHQNADLFAAVTHGV
ncbi:hypothetical protein LTR10_011077 [Elasticomyces elasticus]|nr:hypothetical protein LTR10_011077 [Elasticomyces elasticus]